MKRKATGALGQPYGKIREKLKKLIEDQGYSEVEVFAVQGRERSDCCFDIYRWEGYGNKGSISCSFCSYDTMTKCVKNGIIIEVSPRSSISNLDVYAKE